MKIFLHVGRLPWQEIFEETQINPDTIIVRKILDCIVSNTVILQSISNITLDLAEVYEQNTFYVKKDWDFRGEICPQKWRSRQHFEVASKFWIRSDVKTIWVPTSMMTQVLGCSCGKTLVAWCLACRGSPIALRWCRWLIVVQWQWSAFVSRVPTSMITSARDHRVKLIYCWNRVPRWLFRRIEGHYVKDVEESWSSNNGHFLSILSG